MATRASARNFVSAGPQRGNSSDARANDVKSSSVSFMSHETMALCARGSSCTRRTSNVRNGDAHLVTASGCHAHARDEAHRKKRSLSMEVVLSSRSFVPQLKQNELRVLMARSRAEPEGDAKRAARRARIQPPDEPA